MRILALHPHLAFGQPFSCRDSTLRQAEDNDDGDGKSENVGSNEAVPHDRRVKEAVDVKALRGLGDVRDSEVKSKHDGQPEDMSPRRWVRTRHEDLEECEGRVQTVLRQVTPPSVLGWEPGAAVWVQKTPVDNGHEERISGDRGVVEGVKSLERPRPLVEECDVPAGIAKGMSRGEEEVEGDTPVCQDGEIRKARGRGLACICRPGRRMCTLVADCEEQNRQSIYTLCCEDIVS